MKSVKRNGTVLVIVVFEDVRAEVPDALRPAFDVQPASVGLYEIVHRD